MDRKEAKNIIDYFDDGRFDSIIDTIYDEFKLKTYRKQKDLKMNNEDLIERVQLLLELLDTPQKDYQPLRGPAMNILLGMLKELRDA